MEAKIVDLQEWVSFGGGGFGESFYNKTDDSVILKLNKPGISASKAEEEFLRSKAVFQMGIPSAEPYEFVTDGQRYGMTVQRIQGKESFGRIIADHPERLEELAGVTAEYAKALHSIPCNTESFNNLALRTREMIMENKVIPDNVKARLAGYLDELEPANTCLHGDLNPCNIITANGKVYWIDLGDFGYGDPLLDFNILSHMSGYGPNPLLKHLFHMDRKMLTHYAGAQGEDVPHCPDHGRKGHLHVAAVLPCQPALSSGKETHDRHQPLYRRPDVNRPIVVPPVQERNEYVTRFL